MQEADHMENIYLLDIVKFWNDWLRDENSIARDSYVPSKFDKSLAAAYIGVRRCGKTSIAILNAKTKFKEICYINFEDPYFIENNNVMLLETLPQLYKKIYGKKPEILILDEVHNIPYWERYARKIIDTQSYFLIVTGSSAKMLSSEIATSLTGRCIETDIWPLSFKEFLFFTKKTCKKDDDYLKALDKYLQTGGFPKKVLQKGHDTQTLLAREYLNDIVYKDLVQRFQIRDVGSLIKMIQYLLSNISSKHSFTSIKKAFGLDVVTAQDYAYYCEMAFLLFFVKKYDRNLKVQARNPQKVYCIDTGLRQANAFYHSLDSGKLLENAIYIELRRRGYKNIYYHQNNFELDFVLVEGANPVTVINVTDSNLEDEELYDREVGGILEASQAYGLTGGVIITRSKFTEEIIDGKRIRFIPAYYFLLNKIEL